MAVGGVKARAGLLTRTKSILALCLHDADAAWDFANLTSGFLWCSYPAQLTVMRTLFYTLYLPARLTPGSGGMV